MSTQLAIPFIPARARNTDPVTSHLAAASFSESVLTEIQKDVYAWFVKHTEGTDEEMERDLLSKHPGFSTLRKRRCDLVEMGLLVDSGKKKTNSRNRQMIVWSVR